MNDGWEEDGHEEDEEEAVWIPQRQMQTAVQCPSWVGEISSPPPPPPRRATGSVIATSGREIELSIPSWPRPILLVTDFRVVPESDDLAIPLLQLQEADISRNAPCPNTSQVSTPRPETAPATSTDINSASLCGIIQRVIVRGCGNHASPILRCRCLSLLVQDQESSSLFEVEFGAELEAQVRRSQGDCLEFQRLQRRPPPELKHRDCTSFALLFDDTCHDIPVFEFVNGVSSAIPQSSASLPTCYRPPVIEALADILNATSRSSEVRRHSCAVDGSLSDFETGSCAITLRGDLREQSAALLRERGSPVICQDLCVQRLDNHVIEMTLDDLSSIVVSPDTDIPVMTRRPDRSTVPSLRFQPHVVLELTGRIKAVTHVASHYRYTKCQRTCRFNDDVLGVPCCPYCCVEGCFLVPSHELTITVANGIEDFDVQADIGLLDRHGMSIGLELAQMNSVAVYFQDKPQLDIYEASMALITRFAAGSGDCTKFSMRDWSQMLRSLFSVMRSSVFVVVRNEWPAGALKAGVEQRRLHQNLHMVAAIDGRIRQGRRPSSRRFFDGRSVEVQVGSLSPSSAVIL
ncbi:unnamed protein product (mitochondrion) [Plasmodiophora brassicae]|uniref:CST complex subunit CTC1 n=1 Tax=Plasmodiophora brassicae TaxID=37360 RepID=A0A3P3XZN0_PLABS|nr:unnamed protein product [Plasmodiophora brassicae]